MKIESTLTDMAVLAELGVRFARLRIDAGLTQGELAARAGIGKRTLERLESGDQVQLSTLIRVLRELGRLDAIDVLVPDAEGRPIDLLRARGQSRKRAPRRKKSGNVARPWTWGDEK